MSESLELVRYCQPCGCAVSVFEGRHEWYVCPFHESAPDLLAALKAAFIERDDDVYYHTRNGIPMDVPERIARKVRNAFAKAKERE